MRWNNITETDDILLDLNRGVANYLSAVHPFQYKNKTYRLIDNYAAIPYMECDVCRNYPTFEVSIIESAGGQRLHVCNNCIDSLTGQNISEWFRSFRRKRESTLANRKQIDQ